MKPKIINKLDREILVGDRIHIGDGRFTEIQVIKRGSASLEFLTATGSYFLPYDHTQSALFEGAEAR